MKGQDRLFDTPPPERAKPEGHFPQGVDPIEELVGALWDPTSVLPAGGWEENIPQHLKDRLLVSSLINRWHKLKRIVGRVS